MARSAQAPRGLPLPAAASSPFGKAPVAVPPSAPAGAGFFLGAQGGPLPPAGSLFCLSLSQLQSLCLPWPTVSSTVHAIPSGGWNLLDGDGEDADFGRAAARLGAAARALDGSAGVCLASDGKDWISERLSEFRWRFAVGGGLSDEASKSAHERLEDEMEMEDAEEAFISALSCILPPDRCAGAELWIPRPSTSDFPWDSPGGAQISFGPKLQSRGLAYAGLRPLIAFCAGIHSGTPPAAGRSWRFKALDGVPKAEAPAGLRPRRPEPPHSLALGHTLAWGRTGGFHIIGGPTGAGKSTTMHTLLMGMSGMGKTLKAAAHASSVPGGGAGGAVGSNIISVDDPPELPIKRTPPVETVDRAPFVFLADASDLRSAAEAAFLSAALKSALGLGRPPTEEEIESLILSVPEAETAYRRRAAGKRRAALPGRTGSPSPGTADRLAAEEGFSKARRTILALIAKGDEGMPNGTDAAEARDWERTKHLAANSAGRRAAAWEAAGRLSYPDALAEEDELSRLLNRFGMSIGVVLTCPDLADARRIQEGLRPSGSRAA